PMDYTSLQEKLEYQFRDPQLLRLALTHPSVAHEQSTPVRTNQRLEFLGDAVLQLVLTRELYERFPDFEEGPLTKARAKLVNRRRLAEQARKLELGNCLIVSRGEDLHGGRERDSALADTFEAVLGAVFLDSDFETARRLILQQFSGAFGVLSAPPPIENPKGELQEFLQEFSSQPPRYQILSCSGPDHDRVFACTVQHAGRELARGQGKSKKAAESEAALAALKRLLDDPELRQQLQNGGPGTPPASPNG
ncbi:MAG TPA: ribonuclease III, partial [Clostridia bacterium]|nr:ribonuclease III [Clostridia bacterium]